MTEGVGVRSSSGSLAVCVSGVGPGSRLHRIRCRRFSTSSRAESASPSMNRGPGRARWMGSLVLMVLFSPSRGAGGSGRGCSSSSPWLLCSGSPSGTGCVPWPLCGGPGPASSGSSASVSLWNTSESSRSNLLDVGPWWACSWGPGAGAWMGVGAAPGCLVAFCTASSKSSIQVFCLMTSMQPAHRFGAGPVRRCR